MRKYCEDVNCPNFSGAGCILGFVLKLRLPRSIADCYHRNWGYVMPKVCRKNYTKAKKEGVVEHEG